ncbi:MAG TPA: hypothetical protein VMP13_00560 [Acidimicrobiia bacterium]|nr:hypothetical protein [Acidimicrobiia bacterium]
MTASSAEAPAGIDLYWIPLGAGGSGFVRLNGRIYEAIEAGLQRRHRCALYHTALHVYVPEGGFVVETMWPSPDADTESRGVVVEGAVGARLLARLQTFRYEVRCWRDGVLPDADEAFGGPQRVSDDTDQARRLLNMIRSVPALIWGRDELEAGEMWNSNSVISWLLVQAGLPMETIHPPAGGRAPGWGVGISIAERSPDANAAGRAAAGYSSHAKALAGPADIGPADTPPGDVQ